MLALLSTKDLAGLSLVVVAFMLIYFGGHRGIKAEVHGVKVTVDSVATDVGKVRADVDHQLNSQPADAPTAQRKLDILTTGQSHVAEALAEVLREQRTVSARLADGSREFAEIQTRLTSVESTLFRVATPGTPGGRRVNDPPN